MTVVVPTRDEAGNITELLRRLADLPSGIVSEVVFVDDSDDETPDVIAAAAAEECRFTVRLVHREAGERAGGLSSAAVAGFREAREAWVCVMDSDLQHPPGVVADLWHAASEGSADLVCASRHQDGGGDANGLRFTRRLMSHGSALFARALFPRRFRALSDPMSGFFLARRSAVDLDQLHPRGFKILLEIVARTPGLRIAEVPYQFGTRHAGESKASVREGLTYVRHLTRLRLTTCVARPERLRAAALFGVVGATGIAVNSLALWLMVSLLGIGYVAGAIIATQASTSWNFLLAELWVFRGPRSGPALARFAAFAAVNNAANLLRVPLLALLVSGLGIHYLVANLVTLGLFFAGRFAVSDRLIWAADSGGSGEPSSMKHRYHVGHLVTVASEIKLPELEWFRVPVTAQPADVEVRRGLVGDLRPRRRVVVELAAGRVRYQEHLGALASNFSVDLTGPIRVTVGPLLAASPHVVYTNVVEALLRFVLVSRGSMLLHAAAFELDGRGVMLSARTDTGKTGTILRLMREQQGAFLSDDMVIIGRDGVAHSYPKPLTISAHTMRAVNRHALNRRERAKLAVQSRLHSKMGRTTGAWIASKNLPIMSLNAVVQKLVPPPKYMINRLVACPIITSTRVSDLFIIERGTPVLSDLDHAQALDELIDNTDDAYGFPPYEHFAPAIAIGDDGYLTLRAKERAILAAALRAIRVRRLASDNFSWADSIPQLVGVEAVEPLGGQSQVGSVQPDVSSLEAPDPARVARFRLGAG